jgi:hypothetical protein
LGCTPVRAGCLRGKAAKKARSSRRSRLAGGNCERRLISRMISQSVARSGKCASNVSPKIPRKGDLVRTFEQMMFPEGTGPVPYRFRGRPILDLKILLFEEDRGSVALLDPQDIQLSGRELARPRLRPVFSTQPVPDTAWSIADRHPIKDRLLSAEMNGSPSC